MRLALSVLSLAAMCTVAACGGSSNLTGPAPSGTSSTNGNMTMNGNMAMGGSLSVLTIRGTISNFAFDGNALTNDTNNLQVGVLNPNALYPNGTLNVLSPTSVQASDCTTTSGVRTCTFTITNVDTSTFDGGLMVVTADNRVSAATGDTTQWQTLATFVSPTQLASAQASGTLAGVAAYDLSQTGRTAFASLAGTADSSLITTDGAVIGCVTDGNTPVAGATVKPAAGATSTVAYANAAVTAGTATGPTSTNGLFVTVPASRTSVAVSPATLTVQAPTGSSATWTVPTVPAAAPLWVFVDLAAN